MNEWTRASLVNARREHVLAALKLRKQLRFMIPFWEAAPYRAELRRHRLAARFYKKGAIRT